MIKWTNETRKLGDLIPWPRNPRKIDKDEARRLSESLNEFGQVDIIAVGPANQVYNGHQRLDVWAQEHGPDYEVAVRVASRELTEKEREKLVVLLHKGAAGEWDFDTLANEFELGELLEWGFRPYELGGAEGIDPNELWKGMPEFENEDAFGAILSLKVHFATEDAIKEFSRLVGQTVTTKSTFIWYPRQERENLKAYKCQDES